VEAFGPVGESLNDTDFSDITKMTLQLLPPDPDQQRRLAAAKRSLQFYLDDLGTLQEDYPGWTVVIYDGSLVAAAEDPQAAMDEAREKGFDPSRCLVQIVPAPGKSYFF